MVVLADGSASSLTDGADSFAHVKSGTQPSFVDGTQLTTATAAEFTGSGMGGGMGGGPRGGFGG